jgi:hypothetical protein
MKRLQHISLTVDPAPRQPSRPSRYSAPANPQPREDMWRSRRVLSGSDWMDAWVQKPRHR